MKGFPHARDNEIAIFKKHSKVNSPMDKSSAHLFLPPFS